jgi:ADP-heptose:LPS heptosyltransferase
MKTQDSKLKTQNTIDWQNVKRVLVVRLRSIGDTVLSTPSLIALRRFLPEAQIDILLEDWVAPILEEFDAIDNVLTVSKTEKSRLKTAWRIRRNKYDVAFNLHGGTTATFFVRASGAKHRIGFERYQYKSLYNHRLSSASDFWHQETSHSAEQQLALLGFAGVPVEDKLKSSLTVTKETENSIEKKLSSFSFQSSAFALLHPVAATETKQWATEKFALTVEFLAEKGLKIVAVATPKEREVLEKLKKLSGVSIETFDDLSLPEITALASKAKIFVGNDSGIAHIAAAVKTPSVVIFGSSNIKHWYPWTDAPYEIVYSEKPCDHWRGGIHKGLEDPKCIFCVEIEDVTAAIERVLKAK